MLTNIENTEQTNKDEKLQEISIIKQKITGNYKIIEKIVNFVLYRGFTKNIQNVFGWIYNTLYVLNALDGQNHQPPSESQLSFFETLMAQSIIATFKHQKEKKCLGNEGTKRTAFARMLFVNATNILTFMN